MDVLGIFLTSLVILLLGSVFGLVWLLQKTQKESQESSQQFSSRMIVLYHELSRKSAKTLTASLSSLSETHLQTMKLQATLLDKALALVATSDPVAFQQVQVMGTPTSSDDGEVYDPSDEGEIARIALRNQYLSEQGDDVNAFEHSLIGDLDDVVDTTDYYPVAY